MREDFYAIPDVDAGRTGQGTTLTRIYHDIGLAAVADALDLLNVEFDPEMNESLERGEFYLVPAESAAVAGSALAV
jgi:hypothetical protein